MDGSTEATREQNFDSQGVDGEEDIFLEGNTAQNAKGRGRRGRGKGKGKERAVDDGDGEGQGEGQATPRRTRQTRSTTRATGRTASADAKNENKGKGKGKGKARATTDDEQEQEQEQDEEDNDATPKRANARTTRANARNHQSARQTRSRSRALEMEDAIPEEDGEADREAQSEQEQIAFELTQNEAMPRVAIEKRAGAGDMSASAALDSAAAGQTGQTFKASGESSNLGTTSEPDPFRPRQFRKFTPVSESEFEEPQTVAAIAAARSGRTTKRARTNKSSGRPGLRNLPPPQASARHGGGEEEEDGEEEENDRTPTPTALSRKRARVSALSGASFARRSGSAAHVDSDVSEEDTSSATDDEAVAVRHLKGADLYVTGNNMHGRKTWTREETQCLLDTLYEVARIKKDRPSFRPYAKVLELHGRWGTKSRTLSRWNNVQLKDKARNELIRMRREKLKVSSEESHIVSSHPSETSPGDRNAC